MFRHHRSNTPEQVADIGHFVPLIKKAVERYLRGTGHPHQAIEFCDPATFHRENSDPSLRARRFVKVLSGLEMMPVEERLFTVCFFNFILAITTNLLLLFRSQFMRILRTQHFLGVNMTYVEFLLFLQHECPQKITIYVARKRPYPSLDPCMPVRNRHLGKPCSYRCSHCE